MIIDLDDLLYNHNRIELTELCYNKNIPYLHIYTTGLIGYIRFQINELCIENHADNDRYDLYIHPKQI